MSKYVYLMLLVLISSSAAFAQYADGVSAYGGGGRERSGAGYLMNGFNLGLELTALDGEVNLKGTGVFSSLSGTTKTESSAMGLGASLNYARVPRGGVGFIGGVAVIQKVQNNESTKETTLRSGDTLTQIRPELNLAYGFSSGIWAMIGVHLSSLQGSAFSGWEQTGYGAQAAIGYVPNSKMNFDVGYYLSKHTFKNSVIASSTADPELAGSIDSSSYIMLKQMRARMTILF